MNNSFRAAGVCLFVFICAALATTAAFGDRLKLKNGTVLEGTVILRTDGYWVKTADGKTQIIAVKEVLAHEKGSAPAAPGATPATPAGSAAATTRPAAVGTGAVGPRAPVPTFAGTRAKANMVDNALAAVTLWQGFVDNNPTSADLPTAKQELEKWKTLADGGAEKIKGKWIGGDERQAIIDKADELHKEAQEMLKSNQTLQAVKKLEESATIYPNSFETNFWLGYLSMIQHNEPKALEWFNQVLRVQPDCPEAIANIGVLMIVKKRPEYEKGISLLRKALANGDRQEIVQNLINAINAAPPAMQQNNKQVKEAMEEARLLASKYNISGPNQSFFIIPLKPREQVAKTDGKEKDDDSKGGAGPAGMWSGTGFLVSDDGLILTNRHVVDGGKTLLVVMQDRTQKSAEVVVIDTDQDLALIRIKPDAGKKFSFVKLAAADAPADGADVTVMGFPLIDRLGANIKITRGIVSSGAAGGKRLAGPDVVIDAKVNPGNSGGPILDKHGNVMAIVSMKTVASAMEDTYGLAISAGKIRKFLAKNKVTLEAGADGAAPLTTEEIAAKVKPAAVCILATR